MKMISIGFGNFIPSRRVVAVVSPDSAPIKRLIQISREESKLVDVTFGRKTRSILIMDSGHLFLSGLQGETIMQRLQSDDIISTKTEE